MQELLRNDALPYAEFYQRPNTSLDYAIEWGGYLSQRWLPGQNFALNYVVRPRTSTGFQYVASIAGFSGPNTYAGGTPEPAWPTAAGQTIVDGTVTWTCEAVDTTSLVGTITSSTWTADSGVTIAASSYAGTRSNVIVAAAPTGTLPDGDYYVRNLIGVTNGATYEGVLRISIRNTKL